MIICSSSAMAAFDGILVYGEGGMQTPRYRVWDGDSGAFGGEQTMNNVGGIIEWVQVNSAPIRDEIIVVTADNGDDINVQVNSTIAGTGCWHDGTTCGGVLEVTAASVATDTRKMDVNYEDVTGDALIIYSDNTPVPKMRIYDGTGFTAQLAVNDTSISTVGPLNITGVVEHIRLVSRRGTDELALVYATANDDLNFLIWNGTHFNCESPIIPETGLHTGNFQKFDAAYERLSGDLFIAWGFGTTADLRWGNKTADQCLFSSATMTTFAEIGQQVDVAAHPGSDYIMVSEINGGSADDSHAIAWSGTAWRTSGPNDASNYASEVVPNRLIGSGWAGTSPLGLVVYSDAATNTVVDYHVYNITSNAWLGGGSAAGLDYNATLTDEDNNIKLTSFVDGNKTMVLIKDESQDLWAKIYNGDANVWSDGDGGSALENNVSSLEFPSFDFTWRDFTVAGAADTTRPSWFTPQRNETTVAQNAFVNFTASWTDDSGLSSFIFSINQSLAFVNSSALSFSGAAGGSSNVSKITATTGANISWRFYANDTSGNWNVTDIQSFIVSASTGMLNITLIAPTGINSQVANQTFALQANVTCLGSAGATCGVVNGTARYNQSASNPNTAIIGNGVFAIPFHAIQRNPISCGSLGVGDNPCNVTWRVNATGAVGATYRLDVNFSSDTASVGSNATNYTTMNIIAQAISITISEALANVQFGNSLNPGSANNAAVNNTHNAYNITCGNPGSNCNISIMSNDHLWSSTKWIGISNVSWSQTNDPSTEKNLTLSQQIINNTLADLLSQLIYFWIDIPSGQLSGAYRSNFTIQGQSS